MGTKLVPSIENIEGCFKWGGKWDKKDKICFKEEKGQLWGCTAPLKGIEYWWNVNEFDYDDDHLVYEADLIGNIAGTCSDPFYSSRESGELSELYDTPEEAYEEAKDEAIYRIWDLKTDIEADKVSCFTPRGRPISCEKPNAVAGPDDKTVMRAFRSFYREKPLEEFIKTKNEK